MASYFILDSGRSEDLQGMFMTDPKANCIVLIREVVIPVHLQIMEEQSSYFKSLSQQELSKNSIVSIIPQPFNSQLVVSIFKCIYGFKLKIMRSHKITQIIDVVQFFGFKALQSQILDDIKKNLVEYDCFTILEISKKWGYSDLEKICWDDLQLEDYEQMNYNRFELLNSTKDLFKDIIDQAQNKKKKFFKGNIRGIVQDYCSFNHIQIEELGVLVENSGQDIIYEAEEIEDQHEEDLSKSKDLSTEPSPIDFNNFCSFEEQEGILHKFLMDDLKPISENLSEEYQMESSMIESGERE